MQRAVLFGSVAAIAVLSAWYVGAGVYTLGQLLRLPQVISIAEPQPIGGAMRVVAGQPMLVDYRTGYPSIPLPYGSLEYWIPGMIARLARADDAFSILRIGRLYSLVSLVAVSLLIVDLLRQDSVPWRLAVLAPLPLFWCTYPLRWAVQFAPDFPAIALSLAGWWLNRAGAEYKRSSERRLRIAAQVLLWTWAFHTKPTMVPGMIGYLSEVMISGQTFRGWRQSDWLKRGLPLLLTVLLIVASAFVANVATAGGWYLNAVHSLRANKFSLEYLVGALSFRPALVPLLLLFLAVTLLSARSLCASRAVLLNLCVELVFMSKQGSNLDYLLGSLSLFCISLPHILAAAITRARLTADLKTLTLGAAATAMVLSIATRTAIVSRGEFIEPGIDELEAVHNAVKSYGPDRVLCLDSFTAQRTGAFYPYAEPHQCARLLQLHEITIEPVLDRIRHKEYRAIIVNPYYRNSPVYHDLRLVPMELQTAIQDNYILDTCGKWLCLLKPGRG